VDDHGHELISLTARYDHLHNGRVHRTVALAGLFFGLQLVACHETNDLADGDDVLVTSGDTSTGTTSDVRGDAPDATADPEVDDDSGTSDGEPLDVVSSDGEDTTDTTVTILEDTTVDPPEDTTTVDPPEDTTTVDPPEDTSVVDAGGDAALADADAAADIIVVPPPRHPIITELMALNDGSLLDGYGEASDWIEIYNPHDEPLQLAGYRLSDNPANLTKFVFPAHELPARGFALVFASDRTTGPAGTSEMHAPFKLSGDGETLALATPAGLIIQLVPFPRQLDDVSYGLPFEGDPTPLVTLGDDARYRVLTADESAPAGWVERAFDDGDWDEGPGGFGWLSPPSIAPGPEPEPGFLDALGAPLADSVADWSTAGTQGANGWTYGYWNRTSDGDQTYAASELTPFPANYWTGSMWDWPNGNPPWTMIGQTASHPNGTNNGNEHWAFRRWRSPVAGTLVVAWTIAKSTSGGGGVTGRLFVDGVQRDSRTIGGNDQDGVQRVLTVDVVAGSYVDLAHDALGTSGGRNDGFDGSTLTLRMWLVAGQSDLVGTDLPVGAPGGGLLVRHRFALDPEPDALITLTLHADDGAAAWLDGQLVGGVNAPANEDDPAPTDRPPAAVATPTVVHVPASTLGAGEHVLAVRAWDAAANDGACLVSATLTQRVMALGERWTWFTAPTPGAPNGPAATDLGPIVGGLSDIVEARDADPILVTATIVPTIAPVATTTLYYRVGFGAEVALPFPDDGAAPDAIAGDLVHTALIPASAAGPGQMVRWRVEVSDAAGRLTKEPPYPDPLDSHRYVGTVIIDPAIVSSLPVLHWFVENPDAAATDSGTRGAVFFRGELYDNVRFDVHGQSTRSFPKKSYDVDFNRTQRFLMDPSSARMKDVNLLTNWADKTKFRNTLAYGMLAAAGIGHHLAFPVRVQQNGSFFSVADMVEDGDDRWLERLGRDGEGALYKMYDNMSSTSQGEKKTRKDEGKEDLQALIDALGRSSSVVQTWLWDNVDIPGMVGFAAGFILVSNRDCCHKNYYAYRDTRGTGEWVYLPWDFDLTFGHNWTSQANYFDDTIYPRNTLWVGDGNRLLTPLFANTAFRAMVLRRIRTLMDELLQTSDTPVELRRMELRIAEITQQIGADADLDYTRWGSWGNNNTMAQETARVLANFFPSRRAYLFDELSTQNGTIPARQPADFTVTLGGWEASTATPARGWIRVANPNAYAVDLSGARLTGDVAFVMRAGTVIPAGGELYLAADVVQFRARPTSPRTGEQRFAQGPWVGVLGETPSLRLVDRDGRELALMP